jgi:hypothetical protein
MLRSVKSTQRNMRQLELSVIAGTISHSIAEADVDATANTLSVAAGHGFRTGDRLLVTEVGTLPSGLTTATQYFAIATSTTLFKLATTHANALAGTAIDLADDGTASNTYAAVEKLGGPAAKQAYVQGTAVGTYKIFFIDDQNNNTSFAQAPFVVATGRARDTVISVSTVAAASVILLVDDLDETAALKDGFFNVLIVGSDVTDTY